jgi:tRNA dimethylallyltransferase
MIDIVEPGTKFNLFDYLPLARVAIEDIFSRGKMPIIVGGTGMYVQALTEGFQLEQSLVASHPTPPRLRVAGESIVEHSREQLNLMSKEQLNSILAEIDPGTYENIDINNPYRLIRAIERAQSGERAIKIKPDFEVLQIALDLPREELHSRIDKRVDERFEQGMLEEVVDLINKGVDPEWLVGLGLEYREITNFIINQNNNDEILKPPFAKATEVARQVQDDRQNIMENGLRTPAFAAMAQQLKYKIHQFVRRQLTWFRRFPEIRWAKDYDEVSKIVKEFLRN